MLCHSPKCVLAQAVWLVYTPVVEYPCSSHAHPLESQSVGKSGVAVLACKKQACRRFTPCVHKGSASHDANTFKTQNDSWPVGLLSLHFESRVSFVADGCAFCMGPVGQML